MSFPYNLLRRCCLLLLLVGNFGAVAQNVPVPGDYKVDGTVSVIAIPPHLSLFDTPSYVRVIVPLVPLTQEPTVNSPAATVRVATDYKDGFNRTVQSVQHNAAIGADGSTILHMVQPVDHRYMPIQYSFLPFPSTSAGYTGNLFSEQRNSFYGRYQLEDYTAYTKSQNISDANTRGSKAWAPGKSQVGQGRGSTEVKTGNGANEVRIWTLDANGKPVSNGYYAPYTLFGSVKADLGGRIITTYSDKDGQLVYQKEKQKTLNFGGAIFEVEGITYYVYDDFGRLRYTIPPMAANISSTSVPPAALDSLCFAYNYDAKGRLSEQRAPGEAGFTRFVYDKKQRLVMRQTPNEAVQYQWEITFYDRFSRVKATSLFNGSSVWNRDWWQNNIDNGSLQVTHNILSRYISDPAYEDQYPDETEIPSNTMMSYSYYDNYDRADPTGSYYTTYADKLAFVELLQNGTAEIPVRSKRVAGRLTGMELRILPGSSSTGSWRRSAYYYDDKGRSIYTVTYDLQYSPTLNTFHARYNATQYDFASRPRLNKQVVENFNSLEVSKSNKEVTSYSYDALTGKPSMVRHRVDDSAWQTLAMYNYNEVGALKRNILGNYGEVQDMSYNIRGQLTGINAVYAETGNKYGESKSFGESLKYDYGFTQLRYDGNIAGMIWRGSTKTKAHAYGYSYEPGGRLAAADFRTKTGAGNWENTSLDYSLSNLTYDLNGNILTMNQKGLDLSNTPVTIDQLTYGYSANSNRLLKVNDVITADYGRGDFQDKGSTGNDYSYDASGNLTKDGNKQITSITYNFLNKPEQVLFSDGKTIKYSYDASGEKVQEILLEPSKPTVVKDYVGNFVYENNMPQYALTANGRTVILGTQRREEFFVKDHLGNVRSVVDVYTYPPIEYLATYEVASAHLENLVFDQHNAIVDYNPSSTDPNDVQSGRLNGADPNRRVGTALLAAVMEGDIIDMNFNTFYHTYNPATDNPVGTASIISSLVTTLTNGVGGFVGGEMHNPNTINYLVSPSNTSAIASITAAATDPLKPKAYLNYILFDGNQQVVPEGSGAFQVSGEGTWAPIGTTQPLVIPQNGYLAIYLSNESNNGIACANCDVYFDKGVIRLTRGNLKEETHYYPFGLPITTLASPPTGFMLKNRDRYQGNEYKQEFGLNWMDFHNRQYDPQIGRFLGVDPLAAGTFSLSPYMAMDNNPVSNVDPLGLQSSNYLDYRNGDGTVYSFMDEHMSKFSQSFRESMGWFGKSSVFANAFGEGLNGVTKNYEGEKAQRLWAELSGQKYIPEGTVTPEPLFMGTGEEYFAAELAQSKMLHTIQPKKSSYKSTPETEQFWRDYRELFYSNTPLLQIANYASKLFTGKNLAGDEYAAGSLLEASAPAIGRVGKGGSEILEITTRVGRNGNAVEVLLKNGNKIDINAVRVKEWVPNLHPNAPAGALQKVKFPNAIPGSKGFKRIPTQAEIDYLKKLFK